MARTIDGNPKSGKKYNILAIVAFVAVFLFPLIGLILSIITLVTIRDNQKGKGLAIAGVAIGIFFILITISIILAMVYMITGSLDISKIKAEINNVSDDCADGTCNVSYDGSGHIEVLSNNSTDLRININSTES